jgi:hypothetical protein
MVIGMSNWSADKAWLAAHAFTVQRQREIARLQNALRLLHPINSTCADGYREALHDAFDCARELVTAKLAELQSGMKGAR